MKKISLIALALFTGLAVYSQDQPQLKTEMARKTFFGVKAGANWAKFNVKDYPNLKTNNKTSLHAGLFANIPLGSTFNFQPEVLYNAVGSKMNMTAPGGNMIYEQDLSYVSIPLMFQVGAPGGFYFEFGPQASFLLSAKGEGSGMADVDNKDEFESFDLALNAGVGFTSRVGVGVHARYSYGLTSVWEDGAGTGVPENGPELNNRVLSVGLHYMFGAKN